MIKIAPSLLAADFANLEKEIKDIGNADFVHLDVMDGQFVPNISFGIPVIKALRKHTGLTFDVHLMIKNPLKYIKAFADAGADIITFHVEADDDVSDTIKEIKSCQKKCGIVLSPDTPAEAVIPYLDMVDMILVMSVYPGFGGQKYIPASADKLKKIKEYIGQRDIDLEIDGGITADNVKQVIDAGANVIVAGTSVFGKENRKEAIEGLRK
ncbi:MAG: ribulose-phosphate 3-epimerase [Ruminococcaceae bacterium]|nr:ribulose-phosphate 3-epimerase [Oscillospiraceae bacterium]